ncbi:MAG: hypothetical protein RR177_00280 [Oscillospiraceae bacterium]
MTEKQYKKRKQYQPPKSEIHNFIFEDIATNISIIDPTEPDIDL